MSVGQKSWAAFALALLFLTIPACWEIVSAQGTFDHRALIGEWNGSWVDKHAGRATGQYSLTIEKVAATRSTVEAKSQRRVAAPENSGSSAYWTLTV
jgi:hypothetical protein